MQYPMTIKFTPGEWKLIEDRLEVSDCIADALTDHAEGDEPASNASRDDIIDRVQAMVCDPQVVISDQLDLDILIDAVDGSTMPAKLDDQIAYGTPQEQREARGLKRHIAKVERRLHAMGINVYFPKY